MEQVVHQCSAVGSLAGKEHSTVAEDYSAAAHTVGEQVLAAEDEHSAGPSDKERLVMADEHLAAGGKKHLVITQEHSAAAVKHSAVAVKHPAATTAAGENPSTSPAGEAASGTLLEEVLPSTIQSVHPLRLHRMVLCFETLDPSGKVGTPSVAQGHCMALPRQVNTVYAEGESGQERQP